MQHGEVSAATLSTVSDGFMLNLGAVLLQLCQPFCTTADDPKSLKIDPTYGAVLVSILTMAQYCYIFVKLHFTLSLYHVFLTCQHSAQHYPGSNYYCFQNFTSFSKF